MERQNVFQDEIDRVEAAKAKERADLEGMTPQEESLVTKMFGSDLTKQLAPMTSAAAFDLAGAFAGARMGAQAGMMGGPVGTAIGTLGGTILGGAFSETLRQLLNNEDMDIMAILRQAEMAGLFGLGGEFIGRGADLVSGARKALGKLRAGDSISNEERKMLLELQKNLEAEGITLTPNQLTNSKVYKATEAIANSGITVGVKSIPELYREQGAFMAKQLDDLVGGLGSISRKDYGVAYKQLIKEGDLALQDIVAPRYEAIREEGSKAFINLKNISKEAYDKLEKFRGMIASKEELVARGYDENFNPSPTFARTEEEKLLTDIASLQGTMDFNTLSETLKSINSRRGLDPYINKIVTETYQKILDAAEVSLANKPELFKEFRDVNTFYREAKTALDVETLAAMVNAEKAEGIEYLGETIYKTGNVTVPEASFRAIDKAFDLRVQNSSLTARQASRQKNKLKNQLRSEYLSSALQGTRSAKEDYVVPKLLEFQRRLGTDQKSRDTFNAMTTPKIRKDLTKLLQWASTLDERTAGNWSLAIRGQQTSAGKTALKGAGDLTRTALGASAGALAGPVIALPVAAALMATPSALAKMATSGKVTDKLIQELNTFVPIVADPSQFSRKDIVAAYTRLSGIATEYGIDKTGFDEDLLPQGATLYELYESQAIKEELGLPAGNVFMD